MGSLFLFSHSLFVFWSQRGRNLHLWFMVKTVQNTMWKPQITNTSEEEDEMVSGIGRSKLRRKVIQPRPKFLSWDLFTIFGICCKWIRDCATTSIMLFLQEVHFVAYKVWNIMLSVPIILISFLKIFVPVLLKRHVGPLTASNHFPPFFMALWWLFKIVSLCKCWDVHSWNHHYNICSKLYKLTAVLQLGHSDCWKRSGQYSSNTFNFQSPLSFF